MHIYLTERRTDIKIITDGSELSIIEKTPEEDSDFIKETEEAIKRYENGEFKEMSAAEFLKELRKW